MSVKRERVVDAVARLGDGWYSSQYLPRGYRMNHEYARSVQRPDLVDSMITRMWMGERHGHDWTDVRNGPRLRREAAERYANRAKQEG
jgi:hypothetical protein